MGEVLLFVHVTAVAVWIGAGVTQLIVSPAMGRFGGATAANWMRQTVRLGRVLFSPAAVLVLISGVWMVARESVYEYEQTFVVIGFVAVALGAFLGIRIYGPGGEEVAGLHEAGETDRAVQKHQRLLTIGAAEVAFLLFTVWAMINRIGL